MVWKRNPARETLVRLLGSHCLGCGTWDYEVLEIDHVVPVSKKPRPRRPDQLLLAIRNGTMLQSELQLLCANCHRKKTLHSNMPLEALRAWSKASNYIWVERGSPLK